MSAAPAATAIPVAYDLPGAANAVTASIDHLRREIHAGRLKARKLGRGYRIGHDDLVAWFEQLPEAS